MNNEDIAVQWYLRLGWRGKDNDNKGFTRSCSSTSLVREGREEKLALVLQAASCFIQLSLYTPHSTDKGLGLGHKVLKLWNFLAILN